MKSIRIHKYGTAKELKYEDTEMPAVYENEVLIKVHAVSVNHLEIKKASGTMKESMPLTFPWIPGYDFAGTVDTIGSGIKKFKKGDVVYGNCPGGSYAEFVSVNESTVVNKPEILSFVSAASVPHVGETAWQAIHTHGKLKKGENILIQGAAGAVGAYAVQLAKETGAKVYATASGNDRNYLESLNADIIIDYKKKDFTKKANNIDLVIDLVGGDTQIRSYQIIKPGGRLVSTVGIADENESKKYKIKVIPMVIKPSGKDLESLTKRIKSGKLVTDVQLVLPFEEAGKAWEILEHKNNSVHITHGKIVLEVIKQ